MYELHQHVHHPGFPLLNTLLSRWRRSGSGGQRYVATWACEGIGANSSISGIPGGENAGTRHGAEDVDDHHGVARDFARHRPRGIATGWGGAGVARHVPPVR